MFKYVLKYVHKQIKGVYIMELLQLRYFYESAYTESFTKTANKYCVPPSSVSSSVRLLEKELGCKLFDRSYNRIILNSNGKKLQKSLHSVFSEIDKTVNELKTSDADIREIKILVRAMREKITDYIVEFNKENPHIRFNIVFDFDETQYMDYDVIIDEKTCSYPEYENFELFNMKICLNVSAGSPLLKRRLTLKELCNQPFVSFGEHSNMHTMLINNCKRAGFIPNITAKLNDILCYEKMIESGLGIGLRREDAPLCDNIKSLDVSDFNERYIVFTYYNKDSDYGNVNSFLTFLKNKSKLF